MSADNGIYILVTKKPGSGTEKEYRVVYAQAIENMEFGSTQEEKDYSLVCSFGNPKTPIFTDRDKALEYAHDMAKNCTILEYGVQEIDYTHREFPTVGWAVAVEYWDNWWKKRGVR